MQRRESAMHPLAGNHGSFNFLLYRWRSDSDFPSAVRDSREPHKTYTERDEMKTNQFLKISAAPAGVFCALAFFSMATPAAAAQVDYCRTDTSGMRGCGYSSLEQCQAMASGRGSNCYENPFPEGASAKASSSNASGAYAYQPTHKASKGARKPVEHQ
jgi:Protein of unknown function (DUF3551)